MNLSEIFIKRPVTTQHAALPHQRRVARRRLVTALFDVAARDEGLRVGPEEPFARPRLAERLPRHGRERVVANDAVR
mgnify:CR=1 FL=1